MRYLLIFMFLVGIFVVGKRSFNFSFGGTKGTGPMKTETRSARDFHAVELDLSGDVELRIAEQYSVEVQAQEKPVAIAENRNRQRPTADLFQRKCLPLGRH
ncbi:MAG: hypothetical protein IPL27_05085 [Lewinellaceae bacterium]|nr:hypothetical protein [Lewinellaceae bacterium]